MQWDGEVYVDLCFPFASVSGQGPSTTATFLGIVVDTAQLELHISGDKLCCMRSLVTEWLGRRSRCRLELESLVGHLSHAAVVIRPGRIFLRQLFAVMSKTSKKHHFVHLYIVAKADMDWW